MPSVRERLERDRNAGRISVDARNEECCAVTRRNDVRVRTGSACDIALATRQAQAALERNGLRRDVTRIRSARAFLPRHREHALAAHESREQLAFYSFVVTAHERASSENGRSSKRLRRKHARETFRDGCSFG